MSFINYGSLFTMLGIFIIGSIIYSNPKSGKSLLGLGSFCQTAAFLISLVYALTKYESFVRANSDSYYEFWYFVTLNIYACIINLGFKIYSRYKYRDVE